MPPRPDRAPGANVFTIAASAAFPAALAKGLIERAGSGPLALAGATVYLPTRRAARALTEVFAREAGGATLLPEFRPLGDVDEDELLLDPGAGDLVLPPAIAPLRQRLLLAALIRRWRHTRDGGTTTFGQAVGLAASLAAVMDEVETQGADLAKLEDLAPAALAGHWAEVKDFLSIMRDLWPGVLKDEGCVNPAAHRNEALRALAERLRENPPDRLIVAAGSTGSIPATAELLGVIARLPKGAVVLPGLDRELDQESWERLEPGHPQFTLKQLLERIGVRRADVRDWSKAAGSPKRERLLREVLRPAPTTDAWRALAESGDPPSVEGLTLLQANDPAEEAAVIALLLREALETPERKAALVTRDRSLARRVTAELLRWNIAIDDSAGRPLSHTAAGSFLCLATEAADEGFAPVPLLAMLKHPLAGDAAFRARARELDLRLRGPRPDAGLGGVAKAIAGAPKAVQDWFATVSEALTPLEKALAKPEALLIDILKAHVEAAEALAPALWNGPDGSAANRFVGELARAAADLPKIESGSYAPMLREMLDAVPVRPPFGRHPRLAILGPLEARLQPFDLVILGGLNEGSWPAAAADDPWFSRPMRATLGLEQPERAIGLSAHDFASLASGPAVVLTRALKAEGTPTVASRWVQRLQQLTRGLGIAKALEPPPHYRRIAAALNDPGEIRPEKPPRPCPPVEARPDSLSVTEIEKWVRDPYAIYARRVLELEPLDPLDAETGALERGSALHAILERFVKQLPKEIPEDAAGAFVTIADAVFRETGTAKSVLALWRPRLARVAQWFVDAERERRLRIAESYVEVIGQRVFEVKGAEFTLRGRADRIDKLASGGAAIIDYKTGAPPNDKQVKAHLAPQLPLEGAILAAGGFTGIGKLKAEELVYVRVSGGEPPGEFKPVKADAAVLVHEAVERLEKLIAKYRDPRMSYDSRVGPIFSDYEGDYDHLARVREWSLTGWGRE